MRGATNNSRRSSSSSSRSRSKTRDGDTLPTGAPGHHNHKQPTTPQHMHHSGKVMKTEIKTEIKQDANKAGVSPYTGRQMSRSLLEEFIITYRNHPCLWKIKCKDYLNKDLKYEAYRKLEQICKKEHLHAGREFVVKKINSLRGSFRREYRRVITEEHYVPQLWFYDLMQFTADQESDEMKNVLNGYGVGGDFEFGGSGYGDDKDKIKSEDDENSSNLSYQILQAYDPNDEYTQVLENEEVEQELIINTNNTQHLVETSPEDYVVESMTEHALQHHQLQQHQLDPGCSVGSVGGVDVETSDVLVCGDDNEDDDGETNVIEPDVVMPVMDNSCSSPLLPDMQQTSPGGGDAGGDSGGGGGNKSGVEGYMNYGGGNGGGKLAYNARAINNHSHRSTRRVTQRRQHGGQTNGDLNGGLSSSSRSSKAAAVCDEYTAFGITVAAKMSRMDGFQRLYAENIINQTLFKGLMNQLQPPSEDFWFNPASAIKKETTSSST